MAQTIDVDNVKQLEELLKAAKRKQSDDLAKRGKKVREEVDAYCQKKYGLTLAQIFTAGTATQYKNPDTNEVYSGRGKPPQWFQKLTDEEKTACKIAKVEDDEAQTEHLERDVA